ncbi:MAG: hypothetical protein ACHQUC_01205 [Chlamydiales bacterium]
MYCYNHSTVEAAGMCRHCFKGLCRECCGKNENYLVCSESCAERVKDIEEMNERALSIYGIGKYKKRQRLPSGVIINFCFSIVFISLGISNMILYDHWFFGFDIFFIAIGILFLLIAFLCWKNSKKTGIIL